MREANMTADTRKETAKPGTSQSTSESLQDREKQEN